MRKQWPAHIDSCLYLILRFSKDQIDTRDNLSERHADCFESRINCQLTEIVPGLSAKTGYEHQQPKRAAQGHETAMWDALVRDNADRTVCMNVTAASSGYDSSPD